MKNLFIPYELAVIAKQKGFNEHCFATYNNFKPIKDIVFSLLSVPRNNSDFGKIITAPIYQQLLDWLAEKHKIEIGVPELHGSIYQIQIIFIK